jgi:hypothetical protein
VARAAATKLPVLDAAAASDRCCAVRMPSVFGRNSWLGLELELQPVLPGPSVFGRNLQCQPVRGVDTREECHWSHACKSFKRSKGVKLNGILEWKFLPKTRTVLLIHPRILGWVARGCWLIEREEHRTVRFTLSIFVGQGLQCLDRIDG